MSISVLRFEPGQELTPHTLDDGTDATMEAAVGGNLAVQPLTPAFSIAYNADPGDAPESKFGFRGTIIFARNQEAPDSWDSLVETEVEAVQLSMRTSLHLAPAY